ncbi:MAG: hypothetical protein LOY58_01010 [Gammaproteobacteria bacterium]|jgi:hypothetical protein|nr:hypothetical protein [Gammaproteobacteria bacterium]
METLSLVIALLFAVLFGYFVARMAWVIGRNLLQGLVFRRQLHRRLTGMPLGQVLAHAGSDAVLYLHDRQVHDIERELRNCEACRATRECRNALQEGLPADRFEFCPNYAALFKAQG